MGRTDLLGMAFEAAKRSREWLVAHGIPQLLLLFAVSILRKNDSERRSWTGLGHPRTSSKVRLKGISKAANQSVFFFDGARILAV